MFKSANDIIESALSLIEGEKNVVANLANIAALVFHTLEDVNWVGFYLWDSEMRNLVLGPFQGKPACIRIAPNRGVCGKSFSTKTTQCIPNVHLFEGHIACDEATKSELVVPIIVHGQCIGVFDLDSAIKNRFQSADVILIEKLIAVVATKIWFER